MKNLCFILTLITLFSCNRTNNSLLKEAESMIKSQPDSAVSLLNQIEYPEDMGKERYADYVLLLVQAKDKCEMDIAQDLEMYDAAAYFLGTNNTKKAAWANYYAAKVAFVNENTEKIIEYLLKAQELGAKIADYDLLGYTYNMFGMMHLQEQKPLNARSDYDLSQFYFKKAGNEKNAEYVNALIGYYFLFNSNQQDSALFYFQKTLDYAQIQNDSAQMSYVYKGIGMVYFDKDDYKNAKHYFFQSMHVNNAKQHVNRDLNNLSQVYLKENKIDSAIYYAEKLRPLEKDLQSTFDKYSYYRLLCDIDKHTKNYESAINNYELLVDHIYNLYIDNQQHSIQEIQEKYRTEKIQNAYNRSVIHRQYLVIVVVLSILACILLGWLFLHVRKQRKLETAEADEKMEAMKEILSKQSDEQESKLRPLLMEKLDLVKKCAYVSSVSINEKKKFLARYKELFKEEMLTTLLEWTNIYNLVEKIYPGFVDRIGQYPYLSEKDKQICYLACAGFSSNEMAFILSYTYQSMRVRRVDLQKKMGFENYEDFTDYLRGKGKFNTQKSL